MKKYTLTLTPILFTVLAFSQISPAYRDSAIAEVLNTLTANYVFPETALQAKNYVLKQKAAGLYEKIASGDELARQLTADIYSITNDLHVSVGYSSEILPPEQPFGEPPPQVIEDVKRMLKHDNYGVRNKSILPGNIGYINLSLFGILEFCADTLISAMQFVAETDALIIDLRENGGSMDPATIPFLSGYFFRRPVHLNDFYNRLSNDTVQSWSYGWVPGKRYYDKPVYLLTGPSTFSGAEEFAYDFKNQKRATLIGETTRGGANPGGDIRANDHFSIFVPTGRAINPVTKTNWEGVGVTPDTLIKANRAFYKAHITALEQLFAMEKDTPKKNALESALQTLAANPPVFKQHTFTLEGFANAKDVVLAGSFNNWSPSENRMDRKGGKWTTTIEATPGEHTYKFIVDGNWITDPANKVTKGEGLYTNSVVVIK